MATVIIFRRTNGAVHSGEVTADLHRRKQVKNPETKTQEANNNSWTKSSTIIHQNRAKQGACGLPRVSFKSQITP